MVIEAHLKSVSSFFISSENFDTFEFFVKGYLVVAQGSLGSGAQHRVEVGFYTPPSCHQFPLAVKLGAGEQRAGGYTGAVSREEDDPISM